MDELFQTVIVHLHAAVVHFPIALLLLSVVLDLRAGQSASLRRAAWGSLVLGSLATLPATITGLLAHLPYETSPLLPVIEQHQYLAFATTALFLVLAGWRWRVRRRGSDIGATLPYTAGALLGVVVLLFTVYNGHALVQVHGIGVTHSAP